MLNADAIRKQSENAYKQWAHEWRNHSKIHSKYAMHPLTDFENSGVGKAVLCIANGYSLEREIETIKKYQDNVDILVCDKALGHCLNHGIKPTYVVMCDGRVDAKKYLDPWKDQLKDTVLFANVCGNPEWTKEGVWKDVYFFVNKDILESEKEFSQISGCRNFIPAGTNVSNALVVFLTQSDNEGRKNFFGYDKILLIGFDYCWRADGKYYAFDADGGGKGHYMRHIYTRTIGNDLCYTSNNLGFSAMWISQYISTFNLPVVQCSRDSILVLKHQGKLAEQMQYAFKRDDQGKVKSLTHERLNILGKIREIENELRKIGREHYFAFAGSV